MKCNYFKTSHINKWAMYLFSFKTNGNCVNMKTLGRETKQTLNKERK